MWPLRRIQVNHRFESDATESLSERRLMVYLKFLIKRRVFKNKEIYILNTYPNIEIRGFDVKLCSGF